jgi:hypothetical protein
VSAALTKTVETLSDLLGPDVSRLMRRHRPAIAWLELLDPVIDRGRERSENGERFERRESPPYKPLKPRLEPIEEGFDETPGEPLPPRTRDALRDLVGPEVDQARVHVDEHADAYTRSQHADAVTVGKEIYFRSAAYAPQSPSGLGLIAHELTHVAESNRPGAGWRRSTSDGVRNEERLAGRREQIAAQQPISPVVAPAFAPPPAPPATPSSDVPRPAANAGSAHLRPMRADDDRRPADAPAPQPGPNLETIRRTLFRDLMSQIRVEFERGS